MLFRTQQWDKKWREQTVHCFILGPLLIIAFRSDGIHDLIFRPIRKINVLFIQCPLLFPKKFNITSPTSTRTNPENDSANRRATSIGRMTSGGSSRHIVNNATRLYSQQHTKWSDCAKENKLECNDAPSQVWLFKIEFKDHSLYCESWLWLNRSRYHLLAYLHCFTAVRLKKRSVVSELKHEKTTSLSSWTACWDPKRRSISAAICTVKTETHRWI